MSDARHPFLHGGAGSRASVSSTVLMLHGGREVSGQTTAMGQPTVLRMLDMYVGLRRRSVAAAVYLLRYRVRGWNADRSGAGEPDPVVDARWALEQIGDRHGDVSVVLLGHSMGARTAFAVADHPRVAGICALAPWLPAGEPLLTARADQRFVIAHGTADSMTSAAASLGYAQRLRTEGGAVARFELDGGRHALLDQPRLWHRFAVAVSLGLAGDAELPPVVAAALDNSGSGGLQLPLHTAFSL